LFWTSSILKNTGLQIFLALLYSQEHRATDFSGPPLFSRLKIGLALLYSQEFRAIDCSSPPLFSGIQGYGLILPFSNLWNSGL
jgi:hypothetical protein